MDNSRQLVEACLRNERTAQQQLYKLFAGKLFAVAVRYMKDREDAADVLQESFIKVYKNLASFRFDCPLEAWLKRIVINTALKALDKNKRMGQQIDNELVANHLSVEATGVSQLSYEQLTSLINELPEGCRTIFNLYAIEGYKHHEIAKLLGVTEGTSKSQYSRAKGLLQDRLATLKRQEIGYFKE